MLHKSLKVKIKILWFIIYVIKNKNLERIIQEYDTLDKDIHINLDKDILFSLSNKIL